MAIQIICMDKFCSAFRCCKNQLNILTFVLTMQFMKGSYLSGLKNMI
jgi:hypothetical protein